jgi:hypothetical protein
MTEAELMEHYWSAQEMGISSFLAYISILSAYLVTAFVVGARLTRGQVFFVSFGFVMFQFFCIWGTSLFWTMGYVAALTLFPTHPEIPMLPLNPAYPVAVLQIGGILGSIKFIWDVRHPKAE